MTYDSLTAVFDERNKNLSFRNDTSNINTHVDKTWQIFGEDSKYINGTYKAFIDKPEVFGENSLNFLYALYIGKEYQKDSIYLMFQSFMNKAPETSNSNVLFLWAEELRKYKNFIDLEPTFKILNKVLSAWFTKKTVKYNGHEIPINKFRPILYNTYGVNIIDLLPYIAYLFTYLIYGYAFKFSDAYSSSSLKSFYASLENWFSACYTELYKEQGISILNVKYNTEIPDNIWKAFYEHMLDAQKIIEIRNEEINKTRGALYAMTSTQESINEEDLYEKFNLVLTKLIDLATVESSFKNVLPKIPDFDEKYFVPNETANLTSYFVSGCKNEIIIDEHNDYKYILYNGTYKQLPSVFNLTKPDTSLKGLNYCLGKPFIGADVLLEIFTGMVRDRFVAKRSDQLDELPIYLYPGNLENDELYNFIMPFFVHGIWANENNEMSIILNGLLQNETTRIYITDMLNSYETFKIIYGYTTKTIITPIYMLSLLNTWIYNHCDKNMNLNTFNPFIYMKQSIIDFNRVNKIENILYSMLFINNKEYVRMVNNLNLEFYEMMQSNPLILMPYIQTVNDNTTAFAIGGCDTYKYAKFPNQFIRSFGFISNVMGIDEGINVLYRYTEPIINQTVFDIINDNYNNLTTVTNTLITAVKQEAKLPSILFRWKFYVNENIKYEERTINEFVDAVDTDSGKPYVEIMLKYAFKQTNNSDLLSDEIIRVKEFTINGNMRLNVSIPTTTNSFVCNDKSYTITVSPMGNSVYLPYYGTKPAIIVRNVNFVNPEGKHLRKVLVPSTGIEDNNNVFWIFSTVQPYSKFQSYVHLKQNSIKPSDGSYMLTDRLQQYPKY